MSHPSKARVLDDTADLFERNAVGILLSRFPGTPDESVALWPNAPIVWQRSRDVEPDAFGVKAKGTEGTDPILRLHRDDARAIYDALADHFGFEGDSAHVRNLRSDYLHERGRVDALIEATIRSAERPPVVLNGDPR